MEQAEQARRTLLEEAEQQLAAGRAEAALETLERAALMLHAADAELRIVRAHMGLGQYRRALAFAAHTAGAHREQSAGAALYAWLLHIGGQAVVATRVLADALTQAPEDALLHHAGEQLSADWPQAGTLLRQQPWQAAPAAFGSAAQDHAPAGARVVGSALLLHHGREAVFADGPNSGPTLARESTRMWLRNGLGQTMAVAQRRPLGGPGLHLLVLREALSSPSWSAPAREPFAGSPGFTVEYAPDALGRAAWPLLRQGFFAGVPGTRPHRPLGLNAPRGPRGGPVFDAAGRLVGVASTTEAGDRLFELPLLRGLLDRDALPTPAAPEEPSSQNRVGLGTRPEVAYEAGLRGALQVLVWSAGG